ncbi:MAG: hypothetical protein ABIK92_00540 [Pseudomonadota bacterium]
MKKPLITLFILITFLLFSGCAIRTPQINGLVLDEETKQPVPEAWVTSLIGIRTTTIAGKVNSTLTVNQPHTRTDKEGKFMIPSKKIDKPPFPIGFGTDINYYGVSARTSDYRGGGLNLKDKIGSESDVEVTIYIGSVYKDDEKRIAAYIKDGIKKERAIEIIESERFASLQGLYRYCASGRFAVEVPAVEGGCDDWELDYAIKKYERYLEKTKDDINSGYYNALNQLAELYKRNNEYKKAIDTLKIRINFIEKHGFLQFEVWQRNKAQIEYKINELQNMLFQNIKYKRRLLTCQKKLLLFYFH